MQSAENLRKLFEVAYAFLKTKIDDSVLKKHLTHYTTFRPESMNDVFRQMVHTLKNKQGYVNFIADTEEMSGILYDFDSQKVNEKYGDNWEELFSLFKKKFGDRYRMDKNNKRNAWVM